MSAALVGQSLAAEVPPAAPPVSGGFCVQTMTEENLERETGYTSLDDFQMASAYAQFMIESERDPRIIHAILEASEEAGVDFELMLVKAMLESSLGKFDRPLHVNGGARGLYQFLPATWLTLFAWFGDRYNDGEYADLANAIKFNDNNEPYVDDPQVRQQILDMRHDHYLSSFLKAYQLKYDEAPVLRNMVGGEPSITDFYIVHFLGIPRARVFYRHLHNNPDRSAAAVMSKEARYNRPVFYQGRHARSFAEVYERLERIIQSRLETATNVSADILSRQDCTPPLKKDEPPVPQAPAARVALARFNPEL